MLLSLTISDFVLVDRLELDFAAGFSVLTGETGAGKSILLDALMLALGEKADVGVVRDGAQRAEIGAEFDPTRAPGLSRWLADNDLAGEGDSLLLRRVVEAAGRSRAFINGRPATLQQLREAGEYLLDIHGQHAHYSLIKTAVQRDILDAYAGATALAAETVSAWRAWQQAAQRRQQALRQSGQDSAERERLAWTVEELTTLAFDPQDWPAIQDEQRRLAHAVELAQGAQAGAHELAAEEQGVLSRLKALHGRLAELAGIDPRLGETRDLVEGSLIQAQEAARELSRYGEHVDLDPQRLAEVEARMEQINQAARKHRLRPEDLPGLLVESRKRLDELNAGAELDALERAENQTRLAYEEVAGRLSAARAKAAAGLGKAAGAAMQQLAMPGGAFQAALIPCAPEAGGLETVEFLVSPHAGQPLKPLAKTASGGELSRLGLALQTVLSGSSGAATLVFDEVDAGIGGGVAEIVGRLLARLGRERQVLCVTHLPQVAACADHHWRVSKTTVNGHALSRVEVLTGESRVEEVARMLGGVRLTTTTRRHAAELLGLPVAEG
ncbi:MAG TPA: DNA repair protein RecN [Thiobacillaceae bacterium]|nr:DNA repair protein RecN [Thiobacillaceae bacterium]